MRVTQLETKGRQGQGQMTGEGGGRKGRGHNGDLWGGSQEQVDARTGTKAVGVKRRGEEGRQTLSAGGEHGLTGCSFCGARESSEQEDRRSETRMRGGEAGKVAGEQEVSGEGEGLGPD